MEQCLGSEAPKITAEELVDSFLCKIPPGENCHRASEVAVPKCAENSALTSEHSSLDCEKNTVEEVIYKVPDYMPDTEDVNKLADIDKFSDEEAVAYTPIGDGCIELSMVSDIIMVSSDCCKTEEKNITEASHYIPGAAEVKSLLVDVQLSAENIGVKSVDPSEFKDSSGKEQNKSNSAPKGIDKEASSQAMDVTHSSQTINSKHKGHCSDSGEQQQEQSKSITELLPKEIDKGTSCQAMDVTDSSKTINLKKESDPSDSKDVYREAIEISDSDSDSDDSESSSVSSLSSPSKSDCESDSDIECLSVAAKTKKGTYPVIKAKGELLPEDLPPIEELHISVPSSLCAEIGVVTSIVKTLVVIQSLRGVPALDLDSVLFLDCGSRALGLVFDVFGPVTEPLYCVRFNSEKQIVEYDVNPGDKVYYAPKTEHSKYVFLQQLLRMKGSDASNQYDVERQVQVEYSDDEEERSALTQFGDEIRAEEEGLDLEQLKRKRDPNEVLEKKKKFALQFPPRNQRGGTGRGNFSPRGRPQHRLGPQHRPGHQHNPPPRHQGPIHPPLFNVPPPPIPGPSTQRQNPTPSAPTNNSQGVFPNAFYQNPMQQQSASFGQLPLIQPQMDPRIAQFGAQFAQMVCNLQSSAPGGPIGGLPTAAPSFTAPYSHPLYTDNQSSYNAFYKLPTQSPQNAYSASPFNVPPPPLPQSNLSSINVPPPGHPPFPAQPNQSATFGGQFSSSYSSYPHFR